MECEASEDEAYGSDKKDSKLDVVFSFPDLSHLVHLTFMITAWLFETSSYSIQWANAIDDFECPV